MIDLILQLSPIRLGMQNFEVNPDCPLKPNQGPGIMQIKKYKQFKKQLYEKLSEIFPDIRKYISKLINH